MKIRWLLAVPLVKIALACCSLAPADFHGTRGLAAEISVQGKLVHLLGYQNSALNQASGANAMLLPIPAKPGSMTSKNLLDLSSCPHALEDVQEAAARSIVMRTISASPFRPLEVFDRGLYTVVLAQDANDIPQALERVRPDRRPQLAPAIFEAYEKWYPKWTFALCCFNSRQATEGAPMLWWYQPLNPDQLFFPALDAHNGEPPDLKAAVRVDHALAVSTERMRVSADVHYRDKIAPEVAAYLPTRVLGRHIEEDMPNGDFVFEKKDVRAGDFRPERQLPPGAKSATLPGDDVGASKLSSCRLKPKGFCAICAPTAKDQPGWSSPPSGLAMPDRGSRRCVCKSPMNAFMRLIAVGEGES